MLSPKLSRQSSFALMAVIVLLVSLPTLFCGYYHDDWIHNAVVRGHLPHMAEDALSLFQFVDDSVVAAELIDTAVLPWWTDPEFSIRFFRPLSSALLTVDHLWLGAFGSHVHAMLWFFLVLWLVSGIHRRLLPVSHANWSTLVFGVAGAHASTLAWSSSRHLLIGAACALGALLVQLRWETSKLRSPGAIVALLGTGLLAGEVTLSVVPYLLAYEWFGRRQALAQRLRRSFPAAGVSLIYLVAYAFAGMGTHASGGYVSPFGDPFGFVGAVVNRVPLLLGELVFAVPAGAAHLDAALKSVLQLGGWVALAAAVFLVRRLTKAGLTPLSWLCGASLAACLPISSTLVDGRVLALPMLASSAVIGCCISELRAPKVERRFAGWLRRLVFPAVALVHLGLSPGLRVIIGERLRQLSETQRTLPSRAKLDCPADSQIILINGADPTTSLYAPSVFAVQGHGWRTWHVLTMAMNDIKLRPLDEHSFELELVGERRAHLFERLFRSETNPFTIGQVVSTRYLSATVLKQSRGLPTQVRFTLSRPIADAAHCFVRWVQGESGHLESLLLKPGEELLVPHQRGPMGF